MTATDEMIEAAAKALWCDRYPEHDPSEWGREDHPVRKVYFRKARAALTAALKVAPAGGVKELEWTKTTEHQWLAGTAFGNYQILECGPEWFAVSKIWQRFMVGSFQTLEEAKAAAADDFARRVSECLKAPAGAEAERDALREEVEREVIERLAKVYEADAQDDPGAAFSFVQIADMLRSLGSAS